MNIKTSRDRWIAGAAIIGVVGLVAVGCSATTSGGSSPSGSLDSSGVATTGSISPDGSVIPDGSVTPDGTPVEQSSPGEGSLDPVQTTEQKVLPPVAIKAPADFGNGAKLEITKTARVNVEGQGPGEVSGSGIRFTVKFTNNTGQDIDLNMVTANAFYGADLTPASPTALSSDQPLSGVVKPGQSATGYYTFTIPKNATGDVQLQVSYAANQPVVVLKGSV